MTDINLLENQLQADENIKLKQILSRVQLALVLAVILLGLAGGGFFAANYQAQKSQANAAQDIENKRVELASAVQEDRTKVVNAQGQLQYAGFLLDRHIYWTQVLELLSSISVPGVRYTDLSVSKEGRILIEGLAPDLTAIAAFNKELNGLKGVRQVILNSSALSEGLGSVAQFRFSVTVNFDPEILKFKSDSNGE